MMPTQQSTTQPSQPSIRPTWSEVAHVFQRSGLAMLGASGGFLVAAYLVKANVEALTWPIVVFGLVLYGAAGGYLGIDLPRRDRGGDEGRPAVWIERLGSAGTFLAALGVFVSIYNVVVDELGQRGWPITFGTVWAIGVTLQVTAGIIARRGAVPLTDTLALPAPTRQSGLVG